MEMLRLVVMLRVLVSGVVAPSRQGGAEMGQAGWIAEGGDHQEGGKVGCGGEEKRRSRNDEGRRTPVPPAAGVQKKVPPPNETCCATLLDAWLMSGENEQGVAATRI